MSPESLMIMRRLLPLLTAVLLGTAPAARAQGQSAAGSFPSSFEKVVDNCTGPGMTLGKTTILISKNGKRITVRIPEIPELQGRAGRRGKLRADSTGELKDSKLKARYGFNGRISGEKLAAVFVAEYFKGDKPQCTQSWSVSGKRAKR